MAIDIEGPGDVPLQTKNIRELVDWLWPLIEPMVKNEISPAKEEKHGGFKLERRF